jgi:uncharacterized phage-associated protein
VARKNEAITSVNAVDYVAPASPYEGRSANASESEFSASRLATSCGESIHRQRPMVSNASAFEHLMSIPRTIAKTTETKGRRPKALDVAYYLIYLAACESEPEFLTHMRLQKLLYYVQGWSLALRNRAMFSERIEAWAHGPVVRDLYPSFADLGDKPISPETMLISGRLSQNDRELIESVWEAYKAYSSSSLRAMTHKEAPWKDARGRCAPADRCTTEITRDAMRKFFKQAAESRE